MIAAKNNYKHIEYLLNKYDTRAAGEPQTTEQERERSKCRSNATKHNIANIYSSQLPMFDSDKTRLHFLIDKFDDFKQLHRRASMEQIIACFCFYIMKTNDSSVKINKYSLFKNLRIDAEFFSLICSRMLLIYQQESNLPVFDEA